MKKNYKLLLLLSLFFSFTAFQAVAQDSEGSLKGTVIDSLTKKPADYMTIALKKDNIVIKTVVTEANGTFNFNKISFGKYTITAVAVGYNAKHVPVELSAKNNPADLGSISVAPQVNNLKEVAITADRPIIKQESDRISYDIQADPENKILTALDMMRKVPLLSVDGEDNIKLKGSGNYKILINGKPSGMVSRNPADILKSMPASSIQKIEVITTPPAKYDSEGLAGIINIITNKKIDNGYNGSLNLRMQGPVGGPGIGGFATIKEGKFGATVYGGTGFWSSPATQRTTTRITTGDSPTTLFNDGNRKFNNNYRYGGTELSYEIDTLNLLNAELNPYGGYNKQTVTQFSRLFDGTKHTNYDLLSKNRFGWGGFDASFNYQHGFKDNKEHLLTFSYKYSNSRNPQENNLNFSNRENFTDPNYIQNNVSRSLEQTMQVDYVHPVKKLNIEGGLKGILRKNSSNFEYQSFNSATGAYETDPSRTNNFDNHQDVIGAYNSYSYALGSWNLKAGVRAEGTIVKANFVSTGSNVNTNYFNVIPTASFSKKFKNSSSINFGFTQRIQRPDIETLNPFVDRSIPNIESTGNPNLKAVLSNNFDLTYSTFKKGSITVGASYNFANNTIQQVSVYNEQDRTTRSTYLNIGKDKTLISNFNVNYPISDKWNLTVSGNVGYKWIQGAIDGSIVKNSGFTGYAYMNTGYKFEHGWKANGSFNISAPQVMLQGQSNTYVYCNFSGSKELIKDKLTLSAGISNPFSKFRYYRLTTEGANFKQTYLGENYNRSWNVSLNWKFGQLKDAIKKNQRSINNDDVKSSGSKSGK